MVLAYHTIRSERQADRPPPYRSEPDEISNKETQDEMLARWTLAAVLDLKIGVYWIGSVIAFGFAAILWKLT